MPRRVLLAEPTSGAKLDKLAFDLVKAYQPHVLEDIQPFDIEMFFECHVEHLTGVTTGYKELSFSVHGYTDIETSECMVASALVDDPTKIQFLRSTQSHESAHSLLHVKQFKEKKAFLRFIHDKDHANLRLHREENVPVYCNPEWQAWRLGGALLMPAPMVRKAVGKGYSIMNLSEAFDVSVAFVESRLRGLKIEGVKSF